MDTKLKALKVQELKEILSKASIPPGNAKKQDLINKILANPPAIDVFHTLHPGTKPKNSKPAPPPSTADDDLLAPPEEIDWTVEESITVEPASLPKKSEQPLPSPAPAAVAPPAPAHAVQSEEDKRKARAARFGTTYVEPTQKQSKKAAGENSDLLKARAERFGTIASVTKGRGKRTAPVENVDPEEQERRRKRAERFGLPLSGKA
jgi:SAP domain-containing ribonucleoprotein